ncbi:Sodium-dependent nutrient amino acid transporter 1-like 2 [Homarus americanus]|uniref:Transporter n=1 Tax=Homarus americanus TaxID=6706 RepID=A0A8J5MMX9_HOMAM|nr:Sodium-dependent nutrient amino acid transporter 1-like 2 [Homarus americanus]
MSMEWARPEREQWSNSREFLLSCISMAVGIGNVWRFPFVALENGGGAFLIPYLLVLIFIGKPLYYLEFCLGQFASFGPVKLWELSPAFRGIGYGQAVSTMAVLTFYTFLMGLCVFFFFASFHSVLPWSICGPWASSNCLNSNTNTTLLNFSSFTTAAEEYFREVVLQVDPLGFNNGIGLPEWRLSLCLLASWVIIFIVQAKGVRSSGKAAYFTAIFPYLVLFVMLGRGVTLPGASKGILYFITPRWEKLLEPRVWYAAVEQALFSLTIGFGVVVMLASYNNFRHNVYRDATIISFADTFTSLLAGFTIFSILGHLAELMDVEVSEVLKGGGTTLAFISYPDALARFQYVPQLFSAMFFLMLFTLGLGSAVAYTATIITVICDQFPHIKKWKVTLWVCIVGFLVGLLYTTPQGQHILTLVNHYAGGVSIMFLMILQLVAVMWVYGLKKLLYDIEFMLHRKTGLYWKICWGVLNPLFITIVFVFSQITAKPLTYGDYVFGNVATGFGIGLAGFSVAMVPLFFLLEVWNKKNTAGISTLWEVIQHTFKPTSAWSPMDPDLSKEYHHFLASKKQKSTEGK